MTYTKNEAWDVLLNHLILERERQIHEYIPEEALIIAILVSAGQKKDTTFMGTDTFDYLSETVGHDPDIIRRKFLLLNQYNKDKKLKRSHRLEDLLDAIH